MDDMFLLRYAASCTDAFEACGTNLFLLERHYYTVGLPKRTTVWFNPVEWLATYAKDVFSSNECVCIYKHSNTPKCVLVNNIPVVKNGTIDTQCLKNITQLRLSSASESSENAAFQSTEYYAMNVEQINAYCTHYKADTSNKSDMACLFYVCYGYWNGIHASSRLDALSYVCSYTDLIDNIGVNEDAATFHFYNETREITFDPYVYVASNHSRSESLRECVDPCGNIDPLRACKHYIRVGRVEGLVVDSFDHWEYLANNYKRIKKLMKRCQKLRNVDYDLLVLTKRAVAKDFVKRIKKTKTGRFSSVLFIKAYVDNPVVNPEKTLSVENAAEYFVRAYVACKKVRYDLTLTNKVLLFLKGRALDSMRQVPFNATRYIIENRCL